MTVVTILPPLCGTGEITQVFTPDSQSSRRAGQFVLYPFGELGLPGLTFIHPHDGYLLKILIWVAF